jgi:hypothetical protein
MELHDQLEIGKRAEDFLQYINENPYFNGLLERIKLQYAKEILGLNHEQRGEFAVLRCKAAGIDDVLEAIRGDVFLGAEAFKQLNGLSDEPKGLL